MNFKDFASDKDLSSEEAAKIYLKFISTNTPEAKLFRSSERGGQGIRVRDTKLVARDSIGGSQAVQTFMADSKIWKEYPKRHNSIFCSTTVDIDKHGQPFFDGNSYVILPFKNTKLAVCAEPDFNGISVLDHGKKWELYQLNTELKLKNISAVKLITPEKLDISLMNSDNLSKLSQDKSQEVWFSGTYMSIIRDKFEEFKSTVEEMK